MRIQKSGHASLDKKDEERKIHRIGAFPYDCGRGTIVCKKRVVALKNAIVSKVYRWPKDGLKIVLKTLV